MLQALEVEFLNRGLVGFVAVVVPSILREEIHQRLSPVAICADHRAGSRLGDHVRDVAVVGHKRDDRALGEQVVRQLPVHDDAAVWLVGEREQHIIACREVA